MATENKEVTTVTLAPESSVAATLEQRGKIHGDFSDNADISQSLKYVIHTSKNVQEAKLNAVQLEALEVIATKIARILSGDPNESDNWHDIGGYAKLAEDRCVPF